MFRLQGPVQLNGDGSLLFAAGGVCCIRWYGPQHDMQLIKSILQGNVRWTQFQFNNIRGLGVCMCTCMSASACAPEERWHTQTHKIKDKDIVFVCNMLLKWGHWQKMHAFQVVFMIIRNTWRQKSLSYQWWQTRWLRLFSTPAFQIIREGWKMTDSSSFFFFLSFPWLVLKIWSSKMYQLQLTIYRSWWYEG